MQLLLDLDIKSGSNESADAVFGPFASRTPAPSPLSGTAGFRPAFSFPLSSSLSRHFPFLPAPGRHLLVSTSHEGLNGPVRR